MTLAVAAFMAAICDDTFCLFVSSWVCFHFNDAYWNKKKILQIQFIQSQVGSKADNCRQSVCPSVCQTEWTVSDDKGGVRRRYSSSLPDRFPSRALPISSRGCVQPVRRLFDPRWWYWWAPAGVPSARSSPSAAGPSCWPSGHNPIRYWQYDWSIDKLIGRPTNNKEKKNRNTQDTQTR